MATGTGWLNRLLLLFTAFTISTAFCPPLYCEDNDQSSRPAPPIGVRGESEGRPRVAGEVSDTRSLLEKRGIHLAFAYRGEAFLNVRHDPEGVARYRHLAELALDIDTEKLGLWPRGKFFLRGQNGEGRTVNIAPGGITQPISNIDARDFTQVSQYGFTQKFFGGVLTIDAGKRDVNAIFCVNRDANHFINPVFTLIPTVPMPTFPADALGAAVFVEPEKKLTFGLGTYNGAPKIGGLGFDALFDNKGQYFSVFETHFAPALGPDGLLHGNYRLGFWYMSGPSRGTGAGVPETFHGNYGVYAPINQLIYKRSKNQPSPELDAFMQFGWA